MASECFGGDAGLDLGGGDGLTGGVDALQAEGVTAVLSLKLPVNLRREVRWHVDTRLVALPGFRTTSPENYPPHRVRERDRPFGVDDII